jgi:hypothetical protein
MARHRRHLAGRISQRDRDVEGTQRWADVVDELMTNNCCGEKRATHKAIVRSAQADVNRCPDSRHRGAAIKREEVAALGI